MPALLMKEEKDDSILTVRERKWDMICLDM